MFYVLSIGSFTLYSFLVGKLFFTSLMASITAGHIAMSLLKLIIIIFLFYEILVEWRIYLTPKKSALLKKKVGKNDVYTFISVFIGTLASYLINHQLELGPVVASSLVGLVSSLLLPSFAVAIYCGSFAGMVSSLLVSNPLAIMTVGLFTGLFFLFGTETFKGFGGKLGATAYFGTLMASIFFDTFSNTMTYVPITIEYDTFIVFIIGALGTYFIKEQYNFSVVTASSLVGLTCGLILPNIFSNGVALAVALFCGTFIGMSTTTKLATRISVIIASIIGTIIFLYTTPYFAGLGGKLGLIAFGSTIATAGIYNFKTIILNKSNNS